MGAGAGRGQAATGSSAMMAKFCSTDSGVLYPFAGGGRESGAAYLDLLGPPGRRCGC